MKVGQTAQYPKLSSMVASLSSYIRNRIEDFFKLNDGLEDARTSTNVAAGKDANLKRSQAEARAFRPI